MTEATTGSTELPNAVAVGDPIAADDDFEATVYEAAPTSSEAGEVVIDVTDDPAADDPIERLGPPTASVRRARPDSLDDGADLDAALATLDADSRVDHFTEERVLPSTDETRTESGLSAGHAARTVSMISSGWRMRPARSPP